MTVGYQPQLAVPNGASAGYGLQGLRFLLEGLQKAGKTSLGDTGLAPRFCLDSEAGVLWTPSRKTWWDPARQTVPVADGSWDTCIVPVYDHEVPFRVLDILRTGQHPFNSGTLDSVSNIQQRVIHGMRGLKPMQQADWGQLLRVINAMITGYGDLVTNPVRKLWSVTFIAGAKQGQAGRYRAMLQGQSQDYVPYVPEVTGWVYPAPDGSRHVWIGPHPDYESGNRLWGRLPDDMQLGYPGVVPGWTIETMVAQALGLNG